MRTQDRQRGTTAAGYVLYALRAAEQFVDAEDRKAKPVLLTMYSRRVADNMATAMERLERGGLALGWLSYRSPCQGDGDLPPGVIASGFRTPVVERVSASGCIEGGKGCPAARRFAAR